MFKTYLYIPEELNKKIIRVTMDRKKSKASIMREALEKGLEDIQKEGNASAEVLLKLAEIGEKYMAKGPKDLSSNIDKYLWDDNGK